ncbi:hypothetical protein GQ457_05G014490 [Hibiscus cannabinus]
MLLWLLEVNDVVNMTAAQEQDLHSALPQSKPQNKEFFWFSDLSLPKFFKPHILSKKLVALSRKLKGEAFYFFSPCGVFCPVTNSSKCLKLFHVNSHAVMP